MQADIEPATHPGPGQSLGVGFCLNLPWCSSAAFNLCKELFRCYAPLERQLYYQEDPFNSQHRYLAAVQHRRRQQKGNGKDMRRRRHVMTWCISRRGSGVPGRAGVRISLRKRARRQHEQRYVTFRCVFGDHPDAWLETK